MKRKILKNWKTLFSTLGEKRIGNPSSFNQEPGNQSLLARFARSEVVKIRRLRHPRRVLQSFIARHIVSSSLFSEEFVFVKMAGFVVQGPCGLRGARIETAELQIGSRSWVNQGLYIEGPGSVSIGRDVLLGPQVMIITSNHQKLVGGGVEPEAVHLPVRIGDHCWIGARVTILPGVTILDNVIVAAGAVVTTDIGPDGTYGGVPARKIA